MFNPEFCYEGGRGLSQSATDAFRWFFFFASGGARDVDGRREGGREVAIRREGGDGVRANGAEAAEAEWRRRAG
jgi:hypothetical protein